MTADESPMAVDGYNVVAEFVVSLLAPCWCLLSPRRAAHLLLVLLLLTLPPGKYIDDGVALVRRCGEPNGGTWMAAVSFA